MQLPSELASELSCSRCKAELRRPTPRGRSICVRIARHYKFRHPEADYSWRDDITGGYCRLCWRRLEPGHERLHWQLEHELRLWAPWVTSIDPITLADHDQEVRRLC